MVCGPKSLKTLVLGALGFSCIVPDDFYIGVINRTYRNDGWSSLNGSVNCDLDPSCGSLFVSSVNHGSQGFHSVVYARFSCVMIAPVLVALASFAKGGACWLNLTPGHF